MPTGGYIVALMLASLPATVNAQTFPALTGYVVDQADLSTIAQEDAVADALGAVQRTTRHRFAVVTVPPSGGRPVETHPTALGNRWRLGRRTVKDGVLLRVAPNERRVRIAIGDGSKPTPTDAEAANIIDRRILSRSAKGRMAAGILAGTAGALRGLAS